jgi:hypothetical protein
MKGVVSAMEYTAAGFNYLFNFDCNINSKIRSERNLGTVVPSTYYGIVLQHLGGCPPKVLNFEYQSHSIDYPLDQRTQSFPRSFASFTPVMRFT